MHFHAPRRRREDTPAPPLPGRERRPRATGLSEQRNIPAGQQGATSAPLPKRGGARPGGGRPRGSLGGKRQRVLLQTSKAEVAQEGLHVMPQITSRDIGGYGGRTSCYFESRLTSRPRVPSVPRRLGARNQVLQGRRNGLSWRCRSDQYYG